MRKKSVQHSTITFTAGEREVFARREFLPVSAWASKNLIVQDGIYKGSPLRLDVSPFLAGPMDAFSDPGIIEVTVCGSLQVGKTLFLYACLGWSMVYRPGIKMLTMPTKDSRNRVVEKKLNPLLKGSPTLRRKLGKIRLDTISLMDGSSVELATAESPSQRASITIQDLIVDEEDLYTSSGESRPLDDFKGRTRSYGPYAKIARACQPKGREDSSIWKGITQEADQLFCFEVKCPLALCGKSHVMAVANIVVPCGETDPKLIKSRRLARYQCPECKATWTDHQRDLAVSMGQWQPYSYSAEHGFTPAQAVPDAKSVGFHMPAILSRMVSLSDLAARHMAAEESADVAVKSQFYNDDLALPYTPVELVTDDKKILALREAWLPPLAVPHGAVALTCGIDMQKRGFFYLVRAWMPNLASYAIDYGELESWDQIYKLAFDTYYPVLAPVSLPDWQPGAVIAPEHLTGELMPIWRAGLDTGGTETEGVFTRTEEAYMWVRGNGQGVVYACKGASRQQISNVRRVVRERMPRGGKEIPGGLPLYLLDTGNIKTIDFARMHNPKNTQPIRLHAGCGQDLAEHLSAEQQVRRGNNLVWEKKGGANHWLDCLTLSSACADATWTPSLPHYVLQLRQEQLAALAPPVQHKKRERPEAARRWG